MVARYILVKISRVKENLKMESSREMIQFSGPGRKFMIVLTKLIIQKEIKSYRLLNSLLPIDKFFHIF